VKKLFAAFVVVFAIAAPAALAASHFIKVSPSTVKRGHKVTVSGAVGGGCAVGKKGDDATVYSKAFKGSTKDDFAGVPAVNAPLSKKGTFSFKITINAKKVKKGTYSIGGRCGGGNFGSATLKVTWGP
jgi:hypothetical protein